MPKRKLKGIGMNEVLRQEKKYFITAADSARLGARLGEIMKEDCHNKALGYVIRSLYFDTIYDMDFQEKVDGIELRRKLRLRIYDPEADFAMLEMKQKEGMYQKKRSLRIKREDAQRLVLGDYGPLLEYREPFAAECYGLMNLKCYRPKAVVEYRRRAYVAKENRIRITLDSNITATEACFYIFSPALLQYPVLDSFHVVLEVKYNGFLLSYIKDLLKQTDCSEFSVSKYCLSRKAGLHYETGTF